MRIEEVEIESDNSSKADLLADDVLEEIRNRINFFFADFSTSCCRCIDRRLENLSLRKATPVT